MRKLRILGLDNTKITDAGMKHVVGFSSLAHLTLRNTAVSDAAVGEIRKARPKCEIVR